MIKKFKTSELDGMPIGDRMKFNYEFPYIYRLPDRLPLIIRIDGRAFHTLSKRLRWKKPFDENFVENVQKITLEMCQEIMNTKLAYLQSDEVSFLLIDYEKIETQPWFRGEIQKIASVTAGMASAKITHRLGVEAIFDARIFVMPPWEVCNYFIWRQQDWTRNSINMYARHFFSAKELHGLSCNELQDKIWKEKGYNWNALPLTWKRGSCVLKESNEWKIDNSIPIFTEDRNYINRFVPELNFLDDNYPPN